FPSPPSAAKGVRTPMRRIRSRCCARAAIGHAAAPLPSNVMNSRLFNRSKCIRSPSQFRASISHQRGSRQGLLHGGIYLRLWSAAGQGRRPDLPRDVPLPPAADIRPESSPLVRPPTLLGGGPVDGDGSIREPTHGFTPASILRCERRSHAAVGLL